MKAEIVEVGYIDANGEPMDWVFNGYGQVYAISLGPNGVLYGGYTVEELRELSSKSTLSLPDKTDVSSPDA